MERLGMGKVKRLKPGGSVVRLLPAGNEKEGAGTEIADAPMIQTLMAPS